MSKWFSKWLGHIIICIIGVAIAFYIAWKNAPVRRLMFYSEPTRTVIVKNDQRSNLRITYNNQPITTDVVLAEVDLWNVGNLPIERGDILKPITISTIPQTRILEPTIRATRLDIIHPKLDTSRTAEGKLEISWDLLEEEDAIQLQLLLAGAADTQLAIAGVLKSQPRISVLSIERKTWPSYLLFGSCICFVIFYFLKKRSQDPNQPKWIKSVLPILITICVISFFSMAVWGWISRLTEPRLMPKNLIPQTIQQQLRSFQVITPFMNR